MIVHHAVRTKLVLVMPKFSHILILLCSLLTQSLFAHAVLMQARTPVTSGLTAEYATGGLAAQNQLQSSPPSVIPILGHVLTRTDAAVNFSWSPSNPMPLSTRFVRWSGYITFPVGGTVSLSGMNFNFTTPTLQGTQSSQLQAGSNGHNDTIFTCSYTNVQSGVAYPIEGIAIQVYTSDLIASLSWTYSGVTNQIVPTTALSPAVTTSSPAGVTVVNAAQNSFNISFSPAASYSALAGYFAFSGMAGAINYNAPIGNTLTPVGGPYLINDPNLANNQPYSVTVKAIYNNPVTHDYTQGTPSSVATATSALINPINIPPNPPLGILPVSMNLPDWMAAVEPVDSSEASDGPSGTISVNMAYGVAVVNSGSDLTVGNPLGPDVFFGRLYRTALAAGNLSSPGLPPGWTHNWDYKIVPLTPNAWGPLTFIYPSGAWETITPPVVVGNGFFTPAGVPYFVTGTPSATVGLWQSITFSHNGLSKEVFTMLPNDTVYRLTTKVFANGSQLNFSYDTSFRLLSVSNGTQTLLALSYQNYLNTVTGPSTSSIPINSRTYTYSSGELSSVSVIGSSSMNEWSFSYTPIGSTNQPYVSKVATVDPAGNNATASIGYDTTTGRVLTRTDASGNQRKSEYPSGSGKITVTPTNGTADSFTLGFDSIGRQTGTSNAALDTTSYSYAGSSPAVPDTVTRPAGSALKITTDIYGNTIKVVYPYQNQTQNVFQYPSYARFGLLQSSTEYDQNAAPGPVTQYTYYDSGSQAGFLKTYTTPNGDQLTFTYTATGNILSVVDSVGGTTTYNYTSKDGNIVPELYGRPYSVTNQLGAVTKFYYDDAGRLQQVTDPLNNSAVLSLNQYSQITGITLPSTTVASSGVMHMHSLSYGYQFAGKPATSSTLTYDTATVDSAGYGFDLETQLLSITDHSNLSNFWTLDGESQLLNLTNPSGVLMHQLTYTPTTRQIQEQFGKNATGILWKTTLNTTGNPTTSKLYSLTSNGSVNAQFKSVVTQYGDANDPDLPSSVTATDSSNSLSWTGFISYNAYDLFGRVQDVSSNTPDGVSYLDHTYTYDAEDNILSDTGIAYNGSTLMPYGGGNATVSYLYNADNTRSSMVVTLPNAELASYIYSYDVAKRLTSIVVYPTATPDTSSLMGAVTWAYYYYDLNDRVREVRTPTAVILYTQDELGQIQTIQNLTPDDQLIPNVPGNTVTDPITNKSCSIVSQFFNIAYNGRGQRTGMNFQGLTSFGTQPTYGSGTASWTYDNSNRLTAETWTGNGLSASTYTTSTADPSVSWGHSYDGAGNLTTLRGLSVNTNPLSDQLTSGSAVPGYGSVAFSASGEATSFDGLTIAYDPFGQMTTVGGNCSIAQLGVQHPFSSDYIYDHLGLRTVVSQTFNTTSKDVTYCVYDGTDLVARRFGNIGGHPSLMNISDLWTIEGNNSQDSVFYICGPTGVLGEFDLHGAQKTFFYDPQGNCIQTSALSEGLAGYISNTASEPVFYDGYGQIIWAPHTIATSSQYINLATTQPFQYKGQYGCYTDGMTSLVYCQHRYYDPIIGRWTERDPSGLDGGVNVYSYGNGDPINGADPSGLDWLTDTSNFFGGFGGAITAGGSGAISQWICRRLGYDEFQYGGAYFVAGEVGGTAASFFLPSGPLLKGAAAVGKGAKVLMAVGEARNASRVFSKGLAFEEDVRQALNLTKGTFRVDAGWKYGAAETFRFVDGLTSDGRHAYEMKTGYVYASKFIRDQVAKDLWLLQKDKVKSVDWIFAEGSRVSKPLLKLLKDAGINIRYH